MENNLTNKAKFFAQYLNQKLYKRHDIVYSEHLGIEQVHGDLFATDNTFFIKVGYLELRPLSSITDEEAIHIARLAHQMPTANFTIKARNEHIHVEHTSGVGITHHISIYKDYGTINANIRFSKTEKEPFSTCKANIGETTISSERPVPYIAICDYLRSIGVAIPYMDISVKTLIAYGWIKLTNYEA